MVVRGAEERRHEPPAGAGPGWREVFDLTFWTPHGTFGGHLTLVIRPGGSWLYWTSILEEGRSLVTVVEPHVVPPRSARSLEIRGEGIWADHNCETPLGHWSYGLEAFAVRLDRPEDALDDGRGERVGLGYDLEWEAVAGSAVERLPAGDLVSGRDAEGGAGYRQVGRVHGEILLGADTYELEGSGARSHWWGTGRWPEADGGEGVTAPATDDVEVVGRSMARDPSDGVIERRLLRRAGVPNLVTVRVSS